MALGLILCLHMLACTDEPVDPSLDMSADTPSDQAADARDGAEDLAQDPPEDTPKDLGVGDQCTSPLECGEDKQCVRQGDSFVCMSMCAQPYRRCEGGHICTPIASGSINVCYLGGMTPSGESCTTNMECASGNRCVGTTDQRYCYESCTQEDTCLGDNTCYLTNPDRGICTSPVGVPCSQTRPCQTDLSCSDTLSPPEQEAWPQPICTAACQQDNECPGGTRCKALIDGQPQCVNTCTDTKECIFGAGMICQNAQEACGDRPEDAPCRERFGDARLCVHQDAELGAP